MRVLLSVFDKTGVVDFARKLVDLGCDLVSSGGTARETAAAGIPVTDVADFTGVPAILGHRVVTLHPKVHGGILADRTDQDHLADMAKYGIEGIDLVVVNLYPFHQKPSIETIDIGGSALIRAAAKNHALVGVLVDPADYDVVLEELGSSAPKTLSASTRRRLARKAFAHSAAYDTAIVNWFDIEDGELLPPTLHVSATRDPRELRYGENPHQQAAVYVTDGQSPWWLPKNHNQHGDFRNSYLNLFDADAAWWLVHDLARAHPGKHVCVIVKHANPCGVAVHEDQMEAYNLALSCDERSAFGGIVAFNQPLDWPAGSLMSHPDSPQADVVIVPAYGKDVVNMLRDKRKNTRLLETAVVPAAPLRHLRPISGGWLAQEPHRLVTPSSEWRVVTKRRPTEAEWADAALAFQVCAAVTSNSIVLVKNGVAWGIGAGQQNRVESGLIAKEKAAGRAEGGACASDAFYPFPDGIEAAASAGVAVIVQPGGSVKDDENIAKANELGVAMLFTGERQFKH